VLCGSASGSKTTPPRSPGVGDVCSSSLTSVPSCRDDGVTNPMPLCRCSSLYQRIHRDIQASASPGNAKLPGQPGEYFKVRKSASMCGLSSLTDGRL